MFHTIGQDDTIVLTDDCSVTCLWPPKTISDSVPITHDQTNHYSIVCIVRFQNTRILFPGDIDSTAQRLITQNYGSSLKSDIVIVPHHGSSDAVYPLFFGYIRPTAACISYGKDNTYGHPSNEMLDMLAQLGIQYYTTFSNGSMLWLSNGFYWIQRF